MPYHILIADAEASAALLASTFASAGVGSDRVTDGALAVEAVCAVHYDGVLLALDMPVLDGAATVTVLRAIGFAGPVIALLDEGGAGSPATEGARRLRRRQAGFTRLAGKPLDADALQSILSDLDGATRPPPARSMKASTGTRVPPLPASDTGFENLPAFAGFRASFRAALGARLSDLGRTAAAADWPAVARHAHNLKGSGGTFGFPEVSAHATSIEVAARAGDANGVSAALALLLAHAGVLNGEEAARNAQPGR